jgi:hypothetical protein
LNSVESRQDTVVPKDGGKDSRLRQVRLPATLRYAMLLAALLGLWQIYVTFVGQISLPGPLEVAGALSEGWSDGRLAAATWMTLGTLALGMLIGAMIAVLLSVFAAWTRIGADLLTLLTLTSYRHRSSSQDYLPSPSPASWSKRPSACWSAVPSSDGE